MTDAADVERQLELAAGEDEGILTCSTCGARVGIFLDRPGWQHYHGSPPGVYDAGHEVTFAIGDAGGGGNG